VMDEHEFLAAGEGPEEPPRDELPAAPERRVARGGDRKPESSRPGHARQLLPVLLLAAFLSTGAIALEAVSTLRRVRSRPGPIPRIPGARARAQLSGTRTRSAPPRRRSSDPRGRLRGPSRHRLRTPGIWDGPGTAERPPSRTLRPSDAVPGEFSFERRAAR